MTEVYPSDQELLNQTVESETGVEYIETGKAPYYLEFRKLLYRLLLATRRGNDLRVFAEGGLTIGVKSGKFWRGQRLYAYAGGTGITLADDKAHIYVYLDGEGQLVYDEYGGWPDESEPHVRLADITTGGGVIGSLRDARDHYSFSGPVQGMVLLGRQQADLHLADTSTTLLTVPTGKRCVVSAVMLRDPSSDASACTGLQLGKAGAPGNWHAGVNCVNLTGADAEHRCLAVRGQEAGECTPVYEEGEGFALTVPAGGGAASECLVQAEVFGYFVGL